MILDGKRLGRIEGILAEMIKGAHDEANVRKDAAAFFKALRRLDEGGAELYANKDAVKILTSLIEGRLASQGSRVDIPASVKKFKRDPGTFMKHLMNMNPARLAAQGLSRAAWLFSRDSFTLGLVLLELLEEKEATPKTRPGKTREPKPLTDIPVEGKRGRGRPPRQAAAAGRPDISALKPGHRPAAPLFTHNSMRFNTAGAQPLMLSGLTFCRVI